MKLLKKIATQFVLGIAFVLGLCSFVFANGGGQAGSFTPPTDGTDTFTKHGDSAGGIGVAKSGDVNAGESGGLLDAVKKAINRVLGLLALIALCISLWAGFKMLTASGDDKAYKDGFTMLRQAGVGLIMIGISWLLVSFVFRVINIFTNTQ